MVKTRFKPIDLSRAVSPLGVDTAGLIPVTGASFGLRSKGRQKSTGLQSKGRLNMQIEQHLEGRKGAVLNHGSLLKVDDYQTTSRDHAVPLSSVLPISVSGARNLRQCK